VFLPIQKQCLSITGLSFSAEISTALFMLNKNKREEGKLEYLNLVAVRKYLCVRITPDP